MRVLVSTLDFASRYVFMVSAAITLLVLTHEGEKKITLLFRV